jgi:hypothetical protein
MQKERKAYGVDLVVSKNFHNITTDEFVEKLKSLPGFLGVTEFAGGQTQAALFDSLSNRNKAYNELSKEIECAIIPQTAYIPL